MRLHALWYYRWELRRRRFGDLAEILMKICFAFFALVLALGFATALSACSSSPFGGGYSDANRYRPECSTASSCSGQHPTGVTTNGDDDDWFKDRGL
jgi:hypothetical protein